MLHSLVAQLPVRVQLEGELDTEADTEAVDKVAAGTGVVDTEAADIEVVDIEVVDTEVAGMEAVDMEAVDIEVVDIEVVGMGVVDRVVGMPAADTEVAGKQADTELDTDLERLSLAAVVESQDLSCTADVDTHAPLLLPRLPLYHPSWPDHSSSYCSNSSYQPYNRSWRHTWCPGNRICQQFSGLKRSSPCSCPRIHSFS